MGNYFGCFNATFKALPGLIFIYFALMHQATTFLPNCLKLDIVPPVRIVLFQPIRNQFAFHSGSFTKHYFDEKVIYFIGLTHVFNRLTILVRLMLVRNRLV